jgi:hypothetical protein
MSDNITEIIHEDGSKTFRDTNGEILFTIRDLSEESAKEFRDGMSPEDREWNAASDRVNHEQIDRDVLAEYVPGTLSEEALDYLAGEEAARRLDSHMLLWNRDRQFEAAKVRRLEDRFGAEYDEMFSRIG